ncbi:hypothetical protein PHYBLDRAFT_144996 [Phycomyces blakesleeanus NRRL 1555(-)]|uniref:Uncharacterized protein n=1 Tax=Phycomyces blakesleeanus (strain ATCC 8743b / DSM 1359 / FGSC 10004 / NBRC 33097 / NRRL 1555) TaxID=763407 RepID=A0A163AMR0_PHYB8|nr:hypothetical protein PHYBLDRAFT_144996 [Phycomyces blakesleeanus NRRL 1555(-)]OAD74561.1 hypothetical protein PHYBLDRAFT_144996 [Phycomyces blakesleeanus NRRL 1555(-)]|eukprot:XP_018292601.1 hypothetical protein PHYBLDRAFT_144996 [Phycomyces blakesleeanus NRRL 1555(-)]
MLTNSFADNEITKLKFIDLLGQQYCGKNGSASCDSLVHWFNTSSDRSHEDDGLEFCLPTFSPNSRHCIVPVHCIFLEIATAMITTSRNVSKMLVIALPKKLYV